MARSARLLLVPHGVFLKKSTLKGISGIKHRPSTTLEPYCAGGVASLGWHHRGWWSHLSEPLPPGASHVPQPHLYPCGYTCRSVCIYFSLYLYTQKRHC